MFKKFFLLFFLFTLCILPQSDAANKLRVLTSLPFFDTTLVAIDAYNLTKQEVIFQKNNKMLLRPASNMKVITSIAGLVFLKDDFPFRTKLYYSGIKDSGKIKGNLYVKGGLDPDFKTDDLKIFVDTLRALGIKEIEGNLIGDVSNIDSIFWGKGWMWDDDPSTDAPYLTSLNINDNAVEIKVEPHSIDHKLEVTSKPATSFISFNNNAFYRSGNNYNSLKVDRRWLNRENTFDITGNVYAGNRTTYYTKLNVYNPQLYFLTLLKEKLNEAGIKVSGKLEFHNVPVTVSFLTEKVRPYDSVIVNLNKTSDNLSAEMTLYALGLKYSYPPATAEKGLKLIDSLIHLSGLNPSNYRIVDGSGVSHYNLVSPQLLLGVLKYIYYWDKEKFKVLYESLPIGGVDGTLKNRMEDKSIKGNVHAKTGTLSGVSTLSGYLTASNGDLIAFSIMMQNYIGANSSSARKYQDEICEILTKGIK